MKKQVVVGSERDVRRWCAERELHPMDVIRVFDRGDEKALARLRGAYPEGVQVTQLEPPASRTVAQELHLLFQREHREPPRGWFVAFEGGEGAGKSTQLKLLADRLWQAGQDVVISREPGGTRLGHTIRRVLLDTGYADPPSARTEALLFATDRAHHVDTVVRPALARGAWVLTDRYVDSSIAYQGAGRELREEQVRALSAFATQGLVPDLTVLLDVPVDVGQQRVHDRGGVNRLDAEQWGFHQRVRQRFLDLADEEPPRYLVLDARRSPGQIAQAVALRMGCWTTSESGPQGVSWAAIG